MNTKGEKTRQHIIHKATVLFTKNGFNHTSLSQILTATGLAKGGFYFHFSSKESLALAVIDSLKECWTNEILPKLKAGRDARENLKLMLMLVAIIKEYICFNFSKMTNSFLAEN